MRIIIKIFWPIHRGNSMVYGLNLTFDGYESYTRTLQYGEDRVSTGTSFISLTLRTKNFLEILK